jgi:hypothetical protein
MQPRYPHVCLSSSALFTPPNSNVRYREAKRCPSLPYRWQDSLAVSAIGTFSLERYRPSTAKIMTETSLSALLPGTRTLTCAQHSHSDSSRRRFGSPPWALGATSAARYQTAAKIAWTSTVACAICVSARVFANRAAAHGSAAPSRRIPSGRKAVGGDFRKCATEVPHRFSSCYTSIGALPP